MTQVYVAHHALLLAIPALVPAVVVAGVVVYIAVRDRRSPDNSTDEEHSRDEAR